MGQLLSVKPMAIQSRMVPQFRCSFCGETSSEKKNLDTCAETPAQNVHLKLGDVVWIHQPRRAKRHVELMRTEWMVTGIYYAHPRQTLAHAFVGFSADDWRLFHPVPLHKATLHLQAKSSPNSFIAVLHMTYDEFLLWHEGDRSKLEDAQLLRKPKRTLWQRLIGSARSPREKFLDDIVGP